MGRPAPGCVRGNEYFEYTEFYIFNDIDGDNKKVTIEIYDLDIRIWDTYPVQYKPKDFGYELRNSFIH